MEEQQFIINGHKFIKDETIEENVCACTPDDAPIFKVHPDMIEKFWADHPEMSREARKARREEIKRRANLIKEIKE